MHTPLHGQNAAIAPEAAGARTAPSMKGKTFFYRIGAVRRASVDESQTDDCVQGRTGLDSGGRQMEYGAGDSYCVQQNKIIHVR